MRWVPTQSLPKRETTLVVRERLFPVIVTVFRPGR